MGGQELDKARELVAKSTYKQLEAMVKSLPATFGNNPRGADAFCQALTETDYMQIRVDLAASPALKGSPKAVLALSKLEVDSDESLNILTALIGNTEALEACPEAIMNLARKDDCWIEDDYGRNGSLTNLLGLLAASPAIVTSPKAIDVLLGVRGYSHIEGLAGNPLIGQVPKALQKLVVLIKSGYDDAAGRLMNNPAIERFPGAILTMAQSSNSRVKEAVANGKMLECSPAAIKLLLKDNDVRGIILKRFTDTKDPAIRSIIDADAEEFKKLQASFGFEAPELSVL
jgi:hypothetical protein